jgi:hypothetical protein
MHFVNCRDNPQKIKLMKKSITWVCMLTLAHLLVLNSAAQDKQEILWLVGEEVVKPEMIDQYMEVSKELMELCKAEKFPYIYNVWRSQPFHFALWYPIEEMNDITKIEKAWDAIAEKFGAERFAKFQECIESQINKVMVTHLDLSYVPETPRLKDEDITYCFWQNIYVKKGSEKAVEELFKKAIAVMEEQGMDDALYMGTGNLGYEKPVYFAWSYGKDEKEFLDRQEELDETMAETLGETMKQLNAELIKHITDIVNEDSWWVKDLSYMPEE